MTQVCSVYSQLLQLFPRGQFAQAVRQHQAEFSAKGFTCWEQFVAMLFCQVAHMNSLREVCLGLAGCESPLKHLGISTAPKKSTLADAHANRPWELYESVFIQLLERCQAETALHSPPKFRFKNKLMSLDGSIIDLSASMFDWAKYRQRKGAIKLHLLLDHDGYLPSFAVVTDGKHSELKVARGLRMEAGTILAVDRGYNDYEWFGQLTRDGVFFVTRMKTNTVYTTVEVCAVPEKGNVLSDQIATLPSLDKAGEAPVLFRRIEYWNADKQEILVFFTNLLHLAASTVATIYKDRWQVELFFKVLKQTAKVKSFLGTSANAVKTQIWTALIAMLILKYLQMKSSFGWSLSNLAALLRQQLFVFRDLWAWLNNPLEEPPAAGEQSIYTRSDSVGYCVVAYLPNPDSNGKVLIIEGTTVEATEAGGDFLLSESQMSSFQRTLHVTNLPYFEILLKTSQVKGTPFTATIQAYRIFPNQR